MPDPWWHASPQISWEPSDGLSGEEHSSVPAVHQRMIYSQSARNFHHSHNERQHWELQDIPDIAACFSGKTVLWSQFWRLCLIQMGNSVTKMLILMFPGYFGGSLHIIITDMKLNTIDCESSRVPLLISPLVHRFQGSAVHLEWGRKKEALLCVCVCIAIFVGTNTSFKPS